MNLVNDISLTSSFVKYSVNTAKKFAVPHMVQGVEAPGSLSGLMYVNVFTETDVKGM